MQSSNMVKGKIILQGQIECRSPIHIGSGRADYSDMDIIRDAKGSIFIPASSFVGVLRHALRTNTRAERDNPIQFRGFWGHVEGDNAQQSGLCCSDLTHVEDRIPEVVTRDGVRINNQSGIAEHGGKFDFELLERRARFQLNMEFTYREDDEAFVKQTARTIYELMINDRIRIGARTNSGFGKIALLADTAKLCLFDFFPAKNGSKSKSGSSERHILNWLKRDFITQNAIPPSALGEPFITAGKHFSIIAQLRLNSSLIVRSYAGDARMSDATQLKSCDEWVIPGTSLRGAIRARAERIVNTLHPDGANELIIKLFGHVDNRSRSKSAKKGRVTIQEITLSPSDFPTELQSRIRVDRFTGGVMEGGLFDSMPVFAPVNDKTVTLRMDVEDCEDCEAGLLLLVLKDLWSGDLAVGGEKNVGRGTFQGESAEIIHGDDKILLDKDLSGLRKEQREKLQGLVSALQEWSKTNV